MALKVQRPSIYHAIVTLLSIIGAHSIALPLSPAFPANELQYILNQSQASMLLASSKFDGKAHEVLKESLKGKPRLVKLEKKLKSAMHVPISLERSSGTNGGLMLYTSGTTSRPVGFVVLLYRTQR